VGAKLVGDTAAVTALLDRLLHHAPVLKCGRRLRVDSVRSGLLPAHKCSHGHSKAVSNSVIVKIRQMSHSAIALLAGVLWIEPRKELHRAVSRQLLEVVGSCASDRSNPTRGELRSTYAWPMQAWYLGPDSIEQFVRIASARRRSPPDTSFPIGERSIRSRQRDRPYERILYSQ
jgi:hypothetical protein